MKKCMIVGCEKSFHAKGYCSLHWQRVKKWGDAFKEPLPKLSPAEAKLRKRLAKQKFKKSEKGKQAERRYRASEAYRKTLQRQNSKPEVKARKLRWIKTGKGLEMQRALVRKRRLACKQACPGWVDKRAVSEIYRNCPKGCWVDHIHPLHGENICGLHVPWNLQYLPFKENIIKGNKFDGTYENESWRNECHAAGSDDVGVSE